MKGYVAALVLVLASHATPSAPSTVVCHWGVHCHQWRTVQPLGKSLVTVHERRYAPTILGPWSPWRAVQVTR